MAAPSPSFSSDRSSSPWTTPADKSLTSDGPHQLSISGQSVPREGAASHFQPQKQHTNFSYTPPPWASRAPTPDNYQLRDTNLRRNPDDTRETKCVTTGHS